MNSRERDFRKLLKKHVFPSPDYEITPVESGGTVSGIPDFFWSHRPTCLSGWCELKITDGWQLDLRPHQVGWQVRHAAAGVKTLIAVRQFGRDRGGDARDSLWVFQGKHAGLLNEHGLEDAAGLALCVARGGPKKWDWKAVQACFAS
jgi:hypothetical protein